MNRMISMCVIVSVLVSFGCAGTETIRTVEDDNIFYSSYNPKIRLKINPDFKFNKETDKGDTQFSTGLGEKSANVRVNQFLFVDRSSGNNRGVEIILKELVSPRYFFKPALFNIDNPIDSGSEKIQGKNYQHCTFLAKRKNGYLLVRGMGRLLGANKNAMIVIYYFEPVGGEWGNQSFWSTDQKNWVNKFIEDSRKDIQFLE
jgi:hypothetical protein